MGRAATLQLILDEVYATSVDLKVRTLSSSTFKWSLRHLKCVDDLCLITPSISFCKSLKLSINI